MQAYPIAGSTRKVYERYVDLLDNWLKGREVNDENLAGYLAYLFRKGKTAGYAAVTLSADRWRALCEDKPDPRGRRCKATLANFKREGSGRGRGQVDGLTWEKVETIPSGGWRNPKSRMVPCSVLSIGSDGC